MNIFWLAIKKKKLCFPGFIGELAFWNHHLIKLVLIIVNSENLYHVFFVGKKYFSWVFLYCFVYIYTKEILRFSALFFMKKKMLHCVKRVQIGSYFWFIFSCIQSEYRKIRTRNNCLFGDFPRSAPFYASWKSENIWFSYDFQKQSPGGILLLDFRAYKSQHWSEMD